MDKCLRVTAGYYPRYLLVTAVTGPVTRALLRRKEVEKMGAPVKVPEALYEKLKERATEEGTTLQDTLVALLTKPHQQTKQLEATLAQTRQELASLRKLETAKQEALQQLQERLSKLESNLSRLWNKRNEDVKELNSWVSSWEKVPTLEATQRELEERVTALEKKSHRHWGQE